MEIGVHQAKTHLSQLLQKAAQGEEIVITRSGEPIATIVPIAGQDARVLGTDRGLVTIDPSFDDPLPEDIARSFGS